MKILYLSVSYKEGGESLYNDLIECLNQNGHMVTIVVPKKMNRDTFLEEISFNRRVLHVKAGDWFSSNYIKKGISMLGFSSKMIKAIKKNLYVEHYDLVLYATPPITFNKVIAFCKMKYNCKSFLMLKDIYPQGAIDLEILNKRSLVTRFFKKQENDLYNISDKIGCMSKGNQEYIVKNNNIDTNKTVLFPNSIRIREYTNKEAQNEFTTFIFGGNLGAPQNIKGLLKIIDKMRDFEKAKFVIAGRGKYDFLVKKYVLESGNLQFQYHEFLEKKEYDDLLLNADVGLISLDSRFTIPNIPSKFQTYLNLKKPILAITDKNTDLKDIIIENGCGWWCDSDNISIIETTIREICSDSESIINKGENAFELLVEKFNITDNVKLLEQFVEN